MRTNRIGKFDTKSLIAGGLLAMTAAVLLGAGNADTSNEEILQQRFLVLDSTLTGDAANGYQPHLLTVCPHYGKIDRDSLKFRLTNETQEIRMIVTTAEGCDIRRGDIIGFHSMQHFKLSSGSTVVRQLPSGEREFVP